jgi:NAD(P)-dependent dehydrogenase (short-subunit alcohol dehydrogenase family)
VVADVAQAADVERLAQQTLDAFGAVHLVCNNAGVGVVRKVWECTLADWDWVMGVNLWGVIHGIRVFVPILLAQNDEGHIVNTSSISGLLVGPGASGPYNVSKHGVVALSTTLYHELAEIGAHVHVSVLLPGYVNTRIADAERNRPAQLSNDPGVPFGDREETILARVRAGLAQGMSPDDAAAIVFDAIRAEQFYIFTHAETKEWVREYIDNLLAECNPPVYHG